MASCTSLFDLRAPIESLNDTVIMDLLTAHASTTLTPFVVNLGGGCYSNKLQECLGLDMGTRKLYYDHWPGLLVEARARSSDMLRKELPTSAAVVDAYITPHSIVELLNAHKVPSDAAMLKIDIDGYDCPVVDAMLEAGWRPRVVFMEINGEIPPPLAFSVGYSSTHAIAIGKGGFFGCSLSAASRVMRPRGYSLLQYDMVHTSHDAIWVHESCAHAYFPHRPRWSDYDAYINGWTESPRIKHCPCHIPARFADSTCCGVMKEVMRCVHFRSVTERTQHSIVGRGTYDVLPGMNLTCQHMLLASYRAAFLARSSRGGIGKKEHARLSDTISALDAEMPMRAVFHGDSSDAPYNLSLNMGPEWICLPREQ